MKAALVGLVAALFATPADTAAIGAGDPVVASGTAASVDRRPLHLELRGGLAVGVVENSGAGYDWLPRGAWSLSASYRPLGRFGVYAGYGSTAFGCEAGLCRDRDVGFRDSGVSLGMLVEAGQAWGRAGVTRRTLAASWSVAGEPRAQNSRSGTGLELAAGAAVPLGTRLAVTPGLRWATFAAAFPGGPRADRVESLTADLGLRVAAGGRR